LAHCRIRIRSRGFQQVGPAVAQVAVLMPWHTCFAAVLADDMLSNQGKRQGRK
jgi:hypothetical protein